MEKIKNREKGLNIELEKNYKISNDSSPSKSKYKFVTVHSLIEYLLQKRVLRSRWSLDLVVQAEKQCSNSEQIMDKRAGSCFLTH